MGGRRRYPAAGVISIVDAGALRPASTV